jgi:hypothetical protein
LIVSAYGYMDFVTRDNNTSANPPALFYISGSTLYARTDIHPYLFSGQTQYRGFSGTLLIVKP